MSKHKTNNYQLARYLSLTNMTKLPNRKKRLITKEFCETLRQELIKVFPYLLNDDQLFYGVESTNGWHRAFTNTCEIHNVKSLVKYSDNLGWWRGDQFDGLILERMAEFGVIEKFDVDKFNGVVGRVRWV